ncbi:TetR/AcrR family transcriptional regulator [Plantactinospora sp. GCM10030261]|uniref:TetR/AcrR family transcriptional regulator n=1 Tax=Plantactinospora sp. GCM10030261 TaxID=3273420 RepID=UPI003622FD64
MSSRREQVIEAAIRVLGRDGLRQLTHRAVDAEAGVPSGTTSNHVRTRDALLRAVIERLGALDQADWERFAGEVSPGDPTELAQALIEVVRGAVGPARDRTLARYALALEAAVRPELQSHMLRGRADVLRWAVPWLRRAGSAQPETHARLLLDYLDGVIMHQLSFPEPDFDPGPGVRTLLTALSRTQ